jgi:tartronate-semialdehyde synthase
MALAICTSGPAATDFVTALYTANVDSIQLIAITGQSVTGLLGKEAFQSFDIARIAAPVAKKTWRVTDPKLIREAFYVAREGKPAIAAKLSPERVPSIGLRLLAAF